MLLLSHISPPVPVHIRHDKGTFSGLAQALESGYPASKPGPAALQLSKFLYLFLNFPIDHIGLISALEGDLDMKQYSFIKMLRTVHGPTAVITISVLYHSVRFSPLIQSLETFFWLNL